MKRGVYIETTIPSYLTAWPSRDLVRAAHQQITQEWWATRANYETNEAASLAEVLLRDVPLPDRAASDALHIATAAVHGLDYLLTWNCTHIANVAFRPRIEAVCRAAGYEPPLICTPEELNGVGASHE